jgi:hypothetical protein
MAFGVAEGRGSSYCFVNWLSLCVEVLLGSHLCPEVGEMVQGNQHERSQCLMHYPSMEHLIQNFDQIQQRSPWQIDLGKDASDPIDRVRKQEE